MKKKSTFNTATISLGLLACVTVACGDKNIAQAENSRGGDIESVLTNAVLKKSTLADVKVPSASDGPGTAPPTPPSSKSILASSVVVEEPRCGADLAEWTALKPTAAAKDASLKSIDQRGSRIYFISGTEGSDSTGEIYFWDGAHIIDSRGKAADGKGVAYGADPFAPSSAIKAFKHWSYVAPKRSAVSDIGSKGLGGEPASSFRAGMPDWWLFKRGETFDLKADLLSSDQASEAAILKADGGLSITGGRSVTERQVMGAFGDICKDRPRFTNPINNFVAIYQSRNEGAAVLKNAAFVSLHFDGHGRDSKIRVTGLRLLGQTQQSVDVLFEDVWFDAAGVSLGSDNEAEVTFRRSLVTDSFAVDGAHVQGVMYVGGKKGVLRFEQSVLLRNGFVNGDPKELGWPPQGGYSWDIYNRNLYISGGLDASRSGFFDSISMLGGSGDQFRGGGRIERSFFYTGYVGLGAHGGYSDPKGTTGALLDSVLQRYVAKGSNDDRAHPGWGFLLGGGARNVEVAGNIVSDNQSASIYPSFTLQPVWQDCNVPMTDATTKNHVHDNVFDASTANTVVEVKDGVPAKSCIKWDGKGVMDNLFEKNVFINKKKSISNFMWEGDGGALADDTVYKNNRIYSERAEAAKAEKWLSEGRTLKSYLISRGVIVTSTDGFPEYFNLAVKQRKGHWSPAWTANAIINYIREDYAMPMVRDGSAK